MRREDNVVGAALPGRPTREDRRDHNAARASAEAADPIKALLDRLDAALARNGAVRLPDGRAVRVRAIGCGYAVARRP
jgi:hypothetical protein